VDPKSENPKEEADVDPERQNEETEEGRGGKGNGPKEEAGEEPLPSRAGGEPLPSRAGKEPLPPKAGKEPLPSLATEIEPLPSGAGGEPLPPRAGESLSSSVTGHSSHGDVRAGTGLFVDSL
jgi:hypothetical protein